MATVVFPAPTFNLWRDTVSLYLNVLAGRSLDEFADMPGLDQRLRVWWQCGVPAWVVASALTTICPPRATLRRFFTDRRPEEIRDEIFARLNLRKAAHA
jgi:hypothetical protein